jgi:cyclic pyranopterin phosphate synthase
MSLHTRKDDLIDLGKKKAPGESSDQKRQGLGLLDSYTMRVSVTDRCQLACQYCVPDSFKHTPHHLLSPEDHGRMAALFSDLAITKVRFTGGEPLLRRDLPALVRAWSQALPETVFGLTTNGQFLTRSADALHDAGIRMATIHLDTLRSDRFETLMGKGSLEHALAALDAAKARDWVTKINVVVQRGLNDDELWNFLELSRSREVEVRFIEMMNTGSAQGFVKKRFISGQEIVDLIGEREDVKKVARRHPSDPASLFEAGTEGTAFGLIASDTQPFCDACNRLRITAKGELRGCLYAPSGHSLLDAIHERSDIEAEKTRMRAAIAGKKSHHPDVDEERAHFSMAGVGG